MKIAYLGPKGSFSEIALFEYFDDDVESLPVSNIGDVFESIEHNLADYGIIPIENSIEGSVNNTHDLLINSNVIISGEIELLVKQCLLSKGGSIEDIKIVYAHPQSFAQCQNWIRLNMSKADILPVISNSEGAKMLDNNEQACIGSQKLSTDYNLNILQSDIQDINKTSIIVSPPDSQDSGSLFKVLKSFAAFDVNLSRIESRPSKKAKWSYVFFIDLVGHVDDDNIQSSLEELKELNIEVKSLGSYPIIQK